MDLSKSGNITENYRIIGKTLLQLEPYAGIYNYILKRSPDALQKNLAFIPNEVLQSYLEDLIDFSISDRELFIYRRNFTLTYNIVSIIGLILAVSFGFFLAYSGVQFVMTVLGVLLIAIPSGIVWHLAPKIAPNRRLFFVKLLSHEIKRRNGDDDENNNKTVIKAIDELVRPQETLPGMTRNIH